MFLRVPADHVAVERRRAHDGRRRDRDERTGQGHGVYSAPAGRRAHINPATTRRRPRIRVIWRVESNKAVIGIDIGKNSFHVVGLDRRGAIVLRQKWSRGQVETRLANLPPCLIGMEACVGAHHLSRKLTSLGHNARLMPAKYVRPYSKGMAGAGR
jgi:hypothetical protein